MKFIQNNGVKKFIIALTIVILLFNIVSPGVSYAWDVAGVLFQPFYWMVLGILVPVDFMFSSLLISVTGTNADMSGSFYLNDDILAAIFGQTQWMDDGAKNLLVGPDTIFGGGLTSLNANIFNHDERVDTLKNVVITVAKFYVLLRNIAAIIMLAGLIFTGIRILLSANIPTKKSEYLKILQDWLLGMALLIFSHIIMVLILTLAENITLALNASMPADSIKISLIEKIGWGWDSVTQVLGLVLYIWVSVLVVVFAIAYFKRFFWTCILVIFAPVFCVMYALGQQTKQIYTNWLREFITNAMVQPFHLIVYTVLISIPMDIAHPDGWNWSWENGTELLYGLMAMSMIKPVEKYFRKLFGLDRGIANMASYDSGMKTFKDIGKAATSLAKTAVDLYTGGASAMASGAISQGMKTLGDKTPPATESGETPQWIAENWEKDKQGRYFNPYNEEWFTPEELNSGKDLPSYMDLDDFDEKMVTDEIKNSAKSASQADNLLTASNVTINAGTISLNGASNQHSEEIKTLKEEIKELNVTNMNSDEANNVVSENKKSVKEDDDGISLEMPEFSGFEIFKNLGGLEKLGELGANLFQGLGSITDGLYVDGTAPTAERNNDIQWLRGNIKEAGERRKQDIEREKDNWANNKTNINMMSNKYYQEKYLPEMTKKYAGQLKSGKVDMNYVEAQAREKSDERAKKALKDMSEYVPYGVTDVNVAYQLYDNANKNGFSPEQSVKNMGGYVNFNLNATNINSINQSGAYEKNDYVTVQAAIPAAKTYYDAGYTNIDDMHWVNYMADRLGKTPEFAMKVDEALKKKGKGGKLSYNGKDTEMKKVIDQINSHYGG